MRFRKLTYSGRMLSGDLMGGMVAALIALPYGLAMASLMGLPPVLGLVTSIVTGPITGLLGRNPVLIGGTASATVPFIAAAVQQQGISGAAKICLAASVFMMGFSVMRLGRFVQHVPQAVVTGFSCGIGAMMVLSQIGSMLGVKAPIDRTSNNLLAQTWQVLSRISQTHSSALIISLIVIVLAFVCARRFPKAPAPLLGIVVATLVSIAFGIKARTIGQLPLSVPAFAGFLWTPRDAASLLPSAFGLAFVSSINLLITSRVVEHFRGRHQHLKRADADAELGAYGVANVLAGVFGAPMSVGIPARSLANVRCGGMTRLSNIFHAGFVLCFLAFGRDLIAQVPVAALAAVTAYVGLCLLEWSTWRRLLIMRRTDALAFLSTAIAVLLVNAVLAVAIGCSFYAVRALIARFRRPAQDSLNKLAIAR